MRPFPHSLLVLSIVGIAPTSEDTSIEAFLRDQTDRWCRSHPAALLLTRGRRVRCPEGNRGRRPTETLDGVTLKVGILESDGGRGFDCGVRRGPDGKWTARDNFAGHVLKLLQGVLRFGVVYVPFAERPGETGNEKPALVRLLESNSTDLIACHWAASDMISRWADYLVSTFQTTESFVFVPSNLPLAKDVFLGTFSLRLWIFFLVAIFVLVVSFKFSTFAHWRVHSDHEPWTWSEVILWIVATVSQQGYSRHPRGPSCKAMFLIGYVISYLLYTGFAAGITSLLALNGHRNRLTFDDVAIMKLKLVFQRDEYYFDFIENYFDSSSAFSRILFRSEFADMQTIFEKISKDNFVGYGTTVAIVNHLKKINPIEREEFFVFQIPLFYRQKSFLVSKSFPYKDLFNYWILRFFETGLLDMGKKMFLKSNEASLYKPSNWLSADLGNVFSAVVLLVGGWIFSVVILTLEIVWWNKKKMEKKRKEKEGKLEAKRNDSPRKRS